MSDKPDLSLLLSMLSSGENKNINPEELLGNIVNSSSNNNNINMDDNGPSSSDMPDMETIMKIMKVIKSSNQDSPSKDLLKSLKPFLNDTRQKKVDQYIKILGMTKALEIFNELGDTQK